MAQGITIVGLGSGAADALTVEAWRILGEAQEVYLRTERHPTVGALPETISLHSFDALYEQLDSFEAVYDAIASRVLDLGSRPEGVVYAVPGDPMVGETTVHAIRERAESAMLPVRIVHGVSFLEPTLAALHVAPFDGLQICDATLLAQRHHPPLDADVPVLVAQVYNRALASEAKLTLMALYPDDHPVRVVIGAGMAEQIVRDIPLFELDRVDDLDHLTSAFLPALVAPGSLSSYQDVMARLRSPEDGCPWDREQTHESLREYLLEETYEVLDAIDAGDLEELSQELGDILLQVLFHAQIATENGDFRLIDSIQYAIAKMVRRHPHVFGDAEAKTAGHVVTAWEQIKRQERSENGQQDSSMLDGVSRVMPALAQAVALQTRASRVGADWDSFEPVLAKVYEEMDEYRAATTDDERGAELGDVLFSLVNVARWHGFNAEDILRETNERFRRRFHAIERGASALGRSVDQLTAAQLDEIWEAAKREESR